MAASYLESAEEDLLCPLCFELFVDPNTPTDLNCPHVVCSVCLNQLIIGGPKAEGKLRIISCPECRKETTIPKDGVKAMKVNLRLRSLAEKYKTFDQEQSTNEEIGSCSASCSKHNNKPITSYCLSCECLLCCICSAKHPSPSHDLHDVNSAETELKKQVQKLYSSVKPILSDHETALQALQEKEEMFRSHLADEIQRINKRVEYVIKMETKNRRSARSVQNKGRGLKQQLDKEGTKSLGNCLDLQKHLKEEGTSIRTVLSEANEILQTMGELSKLVDVKFKLNSILQGKCRSSNRVVHMPKVWFKISTSRNELGDIVAHHTCKRFEKIQEFTRTNKTDIIASGANGVILSGGLYQKDICVYTMEGNKRYKKMPKSLPLRQGGKVRVCDMTRSIDGKYIIARDGFVEVYSSDYTFERVLYKSPDVKNDSLAFISIALLPHGNIVLGDCMQKAIVIYDPYGKLQKTILNVKAAPHCIVAIDDTHVVIAQKNMWPFTKLYDINRLTGKKRNLFGVASVKFGICYHQESNNLFSGIPWDTMHPTYLTDDPVHFEPGKANADKIGQCVINQFCASSGNLIVSIFSINNLVRTQVRSITCISMPNVSGSLLATVEHDGIKLYQICEDPTSTSSIKLIEKTEETPFNNTPLCPPVTIRPSLGRPSRDPGRISHQMRKSRKSRIGPFFCALIVGVLAPCILYLLSKLNNV